MHAVQKEWNVRSPDPSTTDHLTDALGCHPLAATVFVNRGIEDPAMAAKYLDPTPDAFNDPRLLPDMDAAVSRITEAIDRGETITIYGDRDVDGVTGTAILTQLLERSGATVGFAIPGKYDGFGIKPRIVRSLDTRGTDLLISVDCGTTDAGAIREATRAGMEVIITDHHEASDGYPDVCACINPHREDAYPHTGLTGAGIAFKLGQELLADIGGTSRSSYVEYALPLAAIGTVVDRGPMTLENRSIARLGFDRLPSCPLPSVRSLVNHCEVESVRDIGWSLGPLLNAAQEDESGHLMLELLRSADENRIEALLDKCEEYRELRSAERQEWEDELTESLTAEAAAKDVVAVETTQYAVPASSQISEQLGKPVVAFYPKDGGFYGGGRTDPDVDLRALFEACDHLLDRCWGHPGAAGFFMAEDHRDEFVNALQTEVRRRYSPQELQPRIDIDAELSPTEVTDELGTVIEHLRPFGSGFEEPHVLVSDLELEEFGGFGSDTTHVAFEPTQLDRRIVWWNGRSRIEDVWDGSGPYDVVGTIARDDREFRFDVADMRPST